MFGGVIIVGRLFQLQVVRADYYRKRAERALVLRPSTLPFVRGRILDRTGEVLVSDEPCWEIAVDYSVIAAGQVDLPKDVRKRQRRWIRRLKLPGDWTDEQREETFRSKIDRMWMDLALVTADFNAISVSEFRALASDIYSRVARVRRIVSNRREFDSPVAEELTFHPVLSGLDRNQQVAASEQFARYPWVEIRPSTQRTFAANSEPFAHVLGRMSRVTAEVVEGDENRDDKFSKYLANETYGGSGVEAAAEQTLRGRRGQVARDRQGQLVEGELVAAMDGEDVSLTIHAQLQRRIYRLLGEAVEGASYSSGGAVVVLDVETREVLALVSYPAYDPNQFDEHYTEWRDDTVRLPLWPRPLASGYAPGSTIKPLVCLAGLMSGRLSLTTRETCTGYLFDDVRDRWRCWQISGTGMRKAHGSVNVVEALTGSCNVFMYRLGEKLGVERLCNVFDMAGIGKSSGIGLPEEATGINPTPDWLIHRRGTGVTKGAARLFAMGQGEILATPVQIANLMAVYGSGEYRDVTVVRNNDSRPRWRLPAKPEHWRAIRQGMYRVVNDPDGTAHRHAFFKHESYALCGKTGSATVHPRATAYRIPYLDPSGARQLARVPAGSRREAIGRFTFDHPKATFDPSQMEVASRWPPTPPSEGGQHSHAWFGAFIQRLDAMGQPDWSVKPRIAFSVLVEFGGSGGRTSGPLGRAIAESLIEILGSDLKPDDDPMELAKR